MSKSTNETNSDYVLGHAQHELGRLIEQARFYGDLTADLLRVAGVREGMRVLDLGCGPGDVSFLAASLVGPTGSVLGVDKSPEAIALANRRAASAGLTNVTFVMQDLADFAVEGMVDAVIGRLILMYFSDPAVILRHALRYLRPGGIVAFHEFDLDGAKSEPPCELYDLMMQRVRLTFQSAGADTRTGLKFPRIFREAGLPSPRLMLHGRAEHGPDSLVYDQLSGAVRTLLPAMDRAGIVRAETVGIDTLAQRLREEGLARDATFVLPIFIGAWTEKST